MMAWLGYEKRSLPAARYPNLSKSQAFALPRCVAETPNAKIADAKQQRDAEYHHEGGGLRNRRDIEIVEIREIGDVAGGVVKTRQHGPRDGESVGRRGERYGRAVQQDVRNRADPSGRINHE